MPRDLCIKFKAIHKGNRPIGPVAESVYHLVNTTNSPREFLNRTGPIFDLLRQLVRVGKLDQAGISSAAFALTANLTAVSPATASASDTAVVTALATATATSTPNSIATSTTTVSAAITSLASSAVTATSSLSSENNGESVSKIKRWLPINDLWWTRTRRTTSWRIPTRTFISYQAAQQTASPAKPSQNLTANSSSAEVVSSNSTASDVTLTAESATATSSASSSPTKKGKKGKKTKTKKLGYLGHRTKSITISWERRPSRTALFIPDFDIWSIRPTEAALDNIHTVETDVPRRTETVLTRRLKPTKISSVTSTPSVAVITKSSIQTSTRREEVVASEKVETTRSPQSAKPTNA